ncbi:MAG: sortase [Candidatus Paceibacterota bacterium]
MNLKFRFLIIFLGAFALIFTVLNSRFVEANVKFWLLTGTDQYSLNRFITTEVKSEKKDLPDDAVIVIESLGVRAPIVFNVGDDTKAIYDNLENGAVHYSNTSKPGEGGVSVVLGHSSAYPWYKGAYGSVFALLGKLQPGDIFYVAYADGSRFVYSMKQAIVFSPFANDERLQEIEKSDKDTVVLLSCWPVGTNYKRIAVQAELVE